MIVTARAPSNVALVKYWGKRDRRLNLPSTGSISVTLDGLETVTTVAFEAGRLRDEVVIDGRDAPPGADRVVGFLDLVRSLAGVERRARVESRSNFPSGAGLASSASAFAALAVACDRALGLGLDPPALSALARRGSGSAARSLVDGFAEMHAGVRPDGADAYAVALGGPELLPMDIAVAVTTRTAKAVGSTEGMARTQATSPFFSAWLRQTHSDLDAMRAALASGDLARVGHVAETNALRMHAVMMASDPPLLYWNAATLRVVHAVRALRADGFPVWLTIDAGPQVKALCAPGRGGELARRLAEIQGVEAVLQSRPGLGARVLEVHP